MSTKSSIYYCESFHLYHEMFRDESVHLDLTSESVNVNLKFKIVDLAKISKSIDLDSLESQSLISDEQIMSYCQKKVVERMSGNSMYRLCGMFVFGDHNLPSDAQVRNGFEFYVKKRDEIKSMVSEIRSAKVSAVHFGLEDILVG